MNKITLSNNRTSGFTFSVIAVLLLAFLSVGFAGSKSVSASAAQPKKPVGRVYVYSEKNRYTHVKIQYKGGGSKKCGSMLAGNTSAAKIKRIPASGALLLSCSQTNLSSPNDGHYELSFGTNSKFDEPPIHVEVGRYNVYDSSPEECSYVHPDSFSPKQPVNCGTGDTSDAPRPLGITADITPVRSSNKKYVAGEVKLRASPGRELSKAECTGNVTVDFITSSPGADTTRMGVPFKLKYVKLRAAGNKSYCLAKLNKKDVLDPGVYSVAVHVPGSIYTPGGDFSSGTTVTIPKR